MYPLRFFAYPSGYAYPTLGIADLTHLRFNFFLLFFQAIGGRLVDGPNGARGGAVVAEAEAVEPTHLRQVRPGVLAPLQQKARVFG